MFKEPIHVQRTDWNSQGKAIAASGLTKVKAHKTKFAPKQRLSRLIPACTKVSIINKAISCTVGKASCLISIIYIIRKGSILGQISRLTMSLKLAR